MIALSPERHLALIGIYDSRGFQALIDVLENITVESENELIGETPGDNPKILALHAIAHAQRAMLTKAVNQIDTLVADSKSGEKHDTMKYRKTVGLTEEH